MEKNLVGFEELRWPNGFVIEDRQVSHLEGRILTIVESLGLPSSQEKAAKDLCRQEVWSILNYAFHITEEQHTNLRKENTQKDQNTTTPYSK